MPLLFSYGTLQEESVQRSLFGRTISGHNDELVGFEQSLAKIDCSPPIASGSGRYHVNVVPNGRSDSRVSGMVFEVTESDLAAADEYENADGYKRMTATLASGKDAWVYAYAPAGPRAMGSSRTP
jgi:gamma-glutamylcyclotransferase (GGCT)/AIG2-like uncharacterized protein YtfP